MKYDSNVFAARIREVRNQYRNKEQGITKPPSQDSFGCALKDFPKDANGFGRDTIGAWEDPNNDRWPPVDVLLKMCEMHNCEMGYLLGEYDQPTRILTDIHNETGLSNEAIDLLKGYRSSQAQDHDNYPLLAEGPGALIPDLVSFILTCKDNSHPYSSNIFAKVVRIRYREKINQVYGDNIPPIVYNICHKVYENVYNALGEVSHKNYDLNIQIQYNEHKDTIQEACPDMSHDDIFKMMDNCFNLLRYENDIDKSLIDIKVARDLSEIISAFFDQRFKHG